MSEVQVVSCQKHEIAMLTYKLGEIKFEFKYSKVLLNEKTIALLNIDYEYEDLNGCIMIESFEVFEKGIGIGTMIIKGLLDIHKGRRFCLYSEPAAEKFWRSLGFVAGDDGEGTEMYYYGLE